MTMQQVHLRINDAATGKPTPVRLRITDANGTYYAPYGRLTKFAIGVNQDVGGNVLIGSKKWCYIDGTCEILLPPGQLHVEITKGFEYKPIDETITLTAGKMSLRFTIERWCDMRKEGWYSGDTRVHFMTPDAALLEGQAEDLAVVNLLAEETTVTGADGKPYVSYPNILSFSGQSYARHSNDCGVAVNTHNLHFQLGSLGLLHCHRIVYPLRADDANWTLNDWCGQCHRKKGLVVWTDPILHTENHTGSEALACLVLGNIDAYEVAVFEDGDWFDALADYYTVLDAGLVVPIVGASAKVGCTRTLGSVRTYAQLNRPDLPAYSEWIEAVRKGRTFASQGPLLGWSVDARDGRATALHAEARSARSFSALEIVGNGEVLASAMPGSAKHAAVSLEIPGGYDGWLAIRCRGEFPSLRQPPHDQVIAQSSPIVIQGDVARNSRREAAIRTLLAGLNNLAEWYKGQNEARLLHVLEEARTVLAEKLSLSSGGN